MHNTWKGCVKSIDQHTKSLLIFRGNTYNISQDDPNSPLNTSSLFFLKYLFFL